jgi:KipI family sensor histidine kinase inhibitor
VSPSLAPLGDHAWLATCVDLEAAAAWYHAAHTLRDRPGVTDVVLAYASVAVYYDPTRIDPHALRDELATLEPRPTADVEGRPIEIPTLYDGEDLPEIADRLGYPIDEIIRLHSQPLYRVFALGFVPGFPYCGFLPEALSGLARRAEPRPRVPAGAVAIAGRQTGIYPSSTPGGWHLLGRTPLTIVDPPSAYFPIRPGDRLRFRPIDSATFDRLSGRRLDDHPALG